MIAGIFHQGSGLGNQLHRYVATRVLAKDKGYEWGMLGVDTFKGKDFMKIEHGGIPLHITSGFSMWNEQKVLHDGVDIRGYDPEINFIRDNSIIDGEFQDPRYFKHRLNDIRTWLEVESLEVPDTTCVIGFRGGEYVQFPSLFLPKSYWEKAIQKMRERGITDFEVHTDDPITAQQFFPQFPIIHDIGVNWRSMRYAKHAIIANSSFYILPRLLAHHDKESITIAPRYWSRHNLKVWSMNQNYYHPFTYIHGEDTD